MPKIRYTDPLVGGTSRGTSSQTDGDDFSWFYCKPIGIWSR